MEHCKSYAEIVTSLIDQSWAKIQIPETGMNLDLLGSIWVGFFENDEGKALKAENGSLEGYFDLNSETAVGENSPDPKEFFQCYNCEILPLGQRAVTEKIVDAVKVVSNNVFKVLYQRGMLISEMKLGEPGNHLLRAIRYHPSGKIYAAAPHTDITMLTFIIWRDVPQIGIINKKGKAELIELYTNEIIVLAGDMLELCTNSSIRSLRHFVPNTKLQSHAITFFANPANNEKLSPTITAGEYLRQRLKEMNFNA